VSFPAVSPAAATGATSSNQTGSANSSVARGRPPPPLQVGGFPHTREWISQTSALQYRSCRVQSLESSQHLASHNHLRILCNRGSATRSRAGGDRTHDRGIMRWERSVGIVRWCRIRSELKENLSGGFGLVR
jgi:hypothetical protein